VKHSTSGKNKHGYKSINQIPVWNETQPMRDRMNMGRNTESTQSLDHWRRQESEAGGAKFRESGRLPQRGPGAEPRCGSGGAEN